MRLLKNAGADRVIDLLEPALQPGGQFDVVTPAFSLFAFSALQSRLAGLLHSHIVIPTVDGGLGLLGNEADRPARNQLQSRWLARRCAEWAKATAMVRVATGKVPQGLAVVRDAGGAARQVVISSIISSGRRIWPGCVASPMKPFQTKRPGRWFLSGSSAPSTMRPTGPSMARTPLTPRATFAACVTWRCCR